MYIYMYPDIDMTENSEILTAQMVFNKLIFGSYTVATNIK